MTRWSGGGRARPADFPIALRMVDLREAIGPLEDVAGYPRTRVFVRDGDALLGSADIRNVYRPISSVTLRRAIADAVAYTLLSRALERRLTGAEGAPPRFDGSVSIVIPTCGRPDDLRRCLASLRAGRFERPVEIVVVDNRPSTGGVRGVAAEFPGVRVVDEPRPGLSYARNAGLAAAGGDICVAIDDDVTVPEGWLERLVAPFARPEVMAVTGHVLPSELDTESQCRFEAYGGLGKGFSRFEVDGAWFESRRSAVPTWQLGATANAAFRSTIFRDPAIGLLDEALGAGMPTGCSEDTYLFYRILKAGHTIVYEPSAWVRHRHRPTMEALTRQIYAYSKGHVAYHLTTLLRDGDRRALVRLGWSLPRVYARRAWERAGGRSDYPLRLLLVEICGNLAGPWALWRSRRRVRRLGPSAPCPPRAHDSGLPAGAARSSDAVPMESPFSQGSVS